MILYTVFVCTRKLTASQLNLLHGVKKQQELWMMIVVNQQRKNESTDLRLNLSDSYSDSSVPSVAQCSRCMVVILTLGQLYGFSSKREISQ